MSDEEKTMLDALRTAFSQMGRAFPTTEEEVRRMEQLLKEDGLPDVPEHLSSSRLAAAIAAGNHSKIIKLPSPSLSDSGQGLARAARKGRGQLTTEIEERMREDKEKNESGKE